MPGKWSTLEVVCHIADFEPILADRMKRVIALDQPHAAGRRREPLCRGTGLHDRDLEEELAVIEMTRKQLARILKALPESAAQRVGIHSERGPKTLAELLTTAANHIPHHVPFIAEKRKALGLSV